MARLDYYMLGCLFSLGVVLLSGVPLFFAANGEPVAIVGAMSGILLLCATGLKAMAVQRDLHEGPVTERCRVVSVVAAHREVLSVRTSAGNLMLTNYTGREGQDLARRWITLTYAPHSGLALSAEEE
ncbi:MAG: hypothetical protein K0R39_2218 [Symbiobacteriaceae bacterium]|jgi:hypothetical protein|nr:hypothetical protein [Symbiobacteriaceae bacterium]